MNTLTPASALFLTHINRIEQRIAHANNQIASGKKIGVASDAPDQIASLLQLRADLQHNQQIQSNLTLATADASSADSTLSAAAILMDQALRLATQGANATQTADTRIAIAEQIAAIQAQMVSYSQTQVQGRYIFSGDQDTSQTYRLNLLPPPDPSVPVDPSIPVDPAALSGVTQLSNAPASRQVEDPAGGSFIVSKSAQEIFGSMNADGTPATDNVFAALNSLRLALLTNSPTGVTSSMDRLHAASTHLNNVLAFYGTVENRITAAQDFASSNATRLQTEISHTEDADIAAAAMELTQSNIQLQAAFQMQARMPADTLFNYLA